jgi:hypothetical protein
LYDIESQLKDGATWLIKISVSLLATVSSWLLSVKFDSCVTANPWYPQGLKKWCHW